MDGEPIKTHQPCPDCGSSDALSVYDNGTFCFSCNTSTRGGTGATSSPKPSVPLIQDWMGDILYQTIGARGISAETCKKFGYGVTEGRHPRNGVAQVAPYYKGGRQTAFKLRFAGKDFTVTGDIKGAQLWGQQLWGTGGKRVVITEGEIDCLSVAQAFGCRWPVVSLVQGAGSARKCISSNLEWVSSFDEIVLAFDADDPGEEAVAEACRILPVGKVKVMHYPGDCKDANDVLRKHGPQAILTAVYQAETWRPDGIITFADLDDSIDDPPVVGWDYPWPSITELTWGIRTSEMIVWAAGTGVGKTTFFKQMEYDLAMRQGHKVGIIHLEETIKETLSGYISQLTGKPAHLPDSGLTREDRRNARIELASKDVFHIYDSFGARSFDAVESKIRYLVTACGCRVVFLDHITALTDDEDADNVNQKVRNIANRLASLCRELDFCLICISHLRKAEGKKHEEGGRVHLDDILGASAIKQWASYVFGLERDQQNEDEEIRTITTIRVLKARYDGTAVGRTVDVKYDRNTNRLYECAGFGPVSNASDF